MVIEKPGAAEHLNHQGVEAATADAVTNARQRFSDADLETTAAEKDVATAPALSR